MALSDIQAADIAMLASIAVSAVLVVAGIGKVSAWRSSPWLQRSIGAGEFVLAGWAAARQFQIFTASAVLIVSAVFLAHAIRIDAEPCKCFGPFLPTTRRPMQRLRNGVLFGIAGIFMATTLIAGHTVARWPTADVGLGIVLAIAIVAVPWAVEWRLDSVGVYDRALDGRRT